MRSVRMPFDGEGRTARGEFIDSTAALRLRLGPRSERGTLEQDRFRLPRRRRIHDGAPVSPLEPATAPSRDEGSSGVLRLVQRYAVDVPMASSSATTSL